MADTINSSSDEEYWSESDNKSASEKEGCPSVKAKRSRKVSATPEREESPSVEVVPPKRSRKAPARFKDSACTPTTSKAIEGFDAMMKDSKYYRNTACSLGNVGMNVQHYGCCRSICMLSCGLVHVFLFSVWSLYLLLLFIINYRESDCKVQPNGEGAESERFSTVTKR